MPFSSHRMKGTYYKRDLSLFMLTLIQYDEVVVVRSLHCEVTFSPLSELPLLKSQCAWPTFQKRGLMRAESTIELPGVLLGDLPFSPFTRRSGWPRCPDVPWGRRVLTQPHRAAARSFQLWSLGFELACVCRGHMPVPVAFSERFLPLGAQGAPALFVYFLPWF